MHSLLELTLKWKGSIHHPKKVNAQIFSNNDKSYRGRKCGDVIEVMVRHRKGAAED